MSKLYKLAVLPSGYAKLHSNHREYVCGRLVSSPEYNSWWSMIRRCYHSTHEQYANYGGRGIRVCTTWVVGTGNLSGFEVFLRDMGSRPDGQTIDRIRVNKHYTSRNCRWATAIQQATNRRKRAA